MRLNALFAILPASAVLLLGACASTPPDPNEPKPLAAGTTWYWVGSATLAEPIAIADPSRYTLELKGDQALVRADCNRGTASADTTKEGRIWLEKMALTRAMCPPDSQDSRYTRELGMLAQTESRGPVMRAEHTQLGNATYFARDPKTRLVVYRCSGTSEMPAALFDGDTLRLWSEERFAIFTRSPAASGERFVSGEMVFHLKGREAFLENAGAKVLNDCRQITQAR